ncbi:TPA: hypothetical protein N0F65_004269 [Lagenidium giganteum]|uniref:RNA polymerase III RPC4 n=1 Tax=Lagenidium giganteum TaxID=4803 RepID=A0AAV2ZD03_9STRA|nr:TPA: hypothetical protein N0F65_004269 [Lagenidium giganteum]
MAGEEQEKKVIRTRIDSSARLASLRTSSADASAAARRPKVRTHCAKHINAPSTKRRTGGDAATEAPRPQQERAEPKAPRADFVRDRTRPARGRFGGRGEGRGRGRGRGNLPTGRVTFVGTLSGGSSYSAGSAPAARTQKTSAADGMGISVLDDDMTVGKMNQDMNAMQIEEQWPPVVKDVMEPMSLPFAREPEPATTGALFADSTGQITMADDTLLFLQLPTTLPLVSAVRINPNDEKATDAKGKQDVKMESAASAPAKDDDAVDEFGNARSGTRREEQMFDGSLSSAPGGFIGKLCVRKSGKVVLMLGDKQFDVETAQTPTFCEEVCSINSKDQQLFMLGNVSRHLVVTPDFDVLLA